MYHKIQDSALWIGWQYEMEIQSALDNLKVTYKANPKDFKEWIANKGRGADIVLPWAEVECKFRTKYFDFVSWIKRDWLPRFHGDGDKIIVTNYKWFVGSKCRKLLYQYGIKLMDTFEFIWYVIKKLGSHSKYVFLLSGIRYLDFLVLHRNGYVVTNLKQFWDT